MVKKRILISQTLLEYAAINKEIVSIGMSSRIEIWSKENWIEYNNLNINFDNIAEQMNEFGI